MLWFEFGFGHVRLLRTSVQFFNNHIQLCGFQKQFVSFLWIWAVVKIEHIFCLEKKSAEQQQFVFNMKNRLLS